MGARSQSVPERATLILNPIIYAEVSIGYSTIEALNAALPSNLYQRESLLWEAGFLAGKSFLAYKRRGGTRNTSLPDFYIGATPLLSIWPCSHASLRDIEPTSQALESFHLRRL